jgi:hypothetical protein
VKDAIGNALLSNIILFMLVVMIAIISGSLSYSKAFRIKNNLLNMIEQYGYDQVKIDSYLSTVGYRVNPIGTQNCPKKYTSGVVLNSSSNYRYCVVEYTTPRGKFYGVTAYMYFDVPLGQDIFIYPVYGETKVIFN